MNAHMRSRVLIVAALWWVAPAVARAELLEVRQTVFGMD